MFKLIPDHNSAFRLLALTHSAEVAEHMEVALEGCSTENKIRMRINGTGIQSYFEDSPADIVLLDLDLGMESAIEELRDFVNTRGRNTAVLVTSPTSSLTDVRSLIKVGVVDFIPQPIEVSDLKEGIGSAVDWLHDVHNGDSRTAGQIVTFMHASGGAGATTLLVEAAAGLAARSRSRDQSATVAALDFDIQFGNLTHNLDLNSESGLINILEAPERLDEEYMQSSMVRHKCGIDVLSTPSRFVPLDAMTPDVAKSVLTEAKAIWPVTFVDMPLAWSDWTPAVLESSDVVVVVTPVSVPAIRRTRRLLDVFHGMDLDDLTILMVTSQICKSAGGRARQREASEAISRGIDYSIRSDRQTVFEAADRGVFCHQVNEKSVATKDIARFVEGLGHQLDLETTSQRKLVFRPSLFRRQAQVSV